ncbi:C2 domain containing protein [Trypanosoma brucei equiperdum]|uniref:C2 domain containing protein n=1 Tax=Trypanosoma brucei equiperdum TaxID=630700 RepID=A0A3L6L259_9TRYP|nr:C2 domain containing protein [Trypanosoma brucei equiperdum]
MTGGNSGLSATGAGSVVLLPRGVYATVFEPINSAEEQQKVALEDSVRRPLDDHQKANISSMAGAAGRFEAQRRLRKAMAAKEATMIQLKQLIREYSSPGEGPNRSNEQLKMVSDKVTGCSLGEINGIPSATVALGHIEKDISVHPAADLTCDAEVLRLKLENEKLSVKETALKREREQLERLVVDLRKELEASGDALRDQTALLQTIRISEGRHGSHVFFKHKPEKLSEPITTAAPSEERKKRGEKDDENEKGNKEEDKKEEKKKDTICEGDKVSDMLKRIEALEGLLALEEKRREAVEKRCEELLAMSSERKAGDEPTPLAARTADWGTVAGRREEEGGKTLKTDPACKEDLFEPAPAVENSPGKSAKDGRDTNLNRVIRVLVEKHRAARVVWARREKEFKRYTQVLESVMTRMERGLPAEEPGKAALFNLTVSFVACENLLNRRNNGALFIDPFVVLYSPIGEKALETLPREDTNCPQFTNAGDTVTFKVVRGLPWSLTFEVYSRGVNNTGLFLGQAKVPVESFLEDVAVDKRFQRKVRLCPRDREPDSEVIQNAHRLGSIIFTACISVVGRDRRSSFIPAVSPRNSAITSSGCRRSVLDVKRSMEAEHYDTVNVDVSCSAGEEARCCSPADAVILRVLSAKGVIKRPSGVYSNPYVVAFDSGTGEELLHTPPVMASSNPQWEHSAQGRCIIRPDHARGSVTFRVYDHDQEGKDRFLGEAHLPKRLIFSGKELHELKLEPRRDESLEYIRRKQHKLGKLVVQCVRKNARSEGERGRTQSGGSVCRSAPYPGAVCGITESSKILHEDSVTNCKTILLDALPIRVTVEACNGLCIDRSDGYVVVCIVSPNLVEYMTSAVCGTADPSWTGTDNSATFSVHPLSSGAIQFHVMAQDRKCGYGGRIVGCAQISTLDLFRRGFGRKKLQLGGPPDRADILRRQRQSGQGTITVFFSLLSSPPVRGEDEVTCSQGKRAAAVSPAAVTNGQSEPSLTRRQDRNTPASTGVAMSIYIKEAHDLLDYDKSMFNVLGVTDPRVTVWVGPNHAFTTPEKRDTVNPKWSLEEAEFQVSVERGHVIRFEVQDVDTTGFDSLGSAVVDASEVIESPGARTLPVMLREKQYGTLTVVFTLVDRKDSTKE